MHGLRYLAALLLLGGLGAAELRVPEAFVTGKGGIGGSSMHPAHMRKAMQNSELKRLDPPPTALHQRSSDGRFWSHGVQVGAGVTADARQRALVQAWFDSLAEDPYGRFTYYEPVTQRSPTGPLIISVGAGVPGPVLEHLFRHLDPERYGPIVVQPALAQRFWTAVTVGVEKSALRLPLTRASLEALRQGPISDAITRIVALPGLPNQQRDDRVPPGTCIVDADLRSDQTLPDTVLLTAVERGLHGAMLPGSFNQPNGRGQPTPHGRCFVDLPGADPARLTLTVAVHPQGGVSGPVVLCGGNQPVWISVMRTTVGLKITFNTDADIDIRGLMLADDAWQVLTVAYDIPARILRVAHNGRLAPKTELPPHLLGLSVQERGREADERRLYFQGNMNGSPFRGWLHTLRVHAGARSADEILAEQREILEKLPADAPAITVEARK